MIAMKLYQDSQRRRRQLEKVAIGIPIKKKDIPCQKCCNIYATRQSGKYTSNICYLEEMKKCPIWKYRDSEAMIINDA